MNMKKTIKLGKIDYNKNGRKVNSVEIDIELREQENGIEEFSACGNIWNNRHTNIYCGGQCLDTINKYFSTYKLFQEIYDLWKKYHLNGLNAGTRKQTDIVNEYFKKNGKKYDYDVACKVLKEKNLYFDNLNDDEKFSCKCGKDPKHYGYGTAWVSWVIPTEDLKRIKALFS